MAQGHKAEDKKKGVSGNQGIGGLLDYWMGGWVD